MEELKEMRSPEGLVAEGLDFFRKQYLTNTLSLSTIGMELYLSSSSLKFFSLILSMLAANYSETSLNSLHFLKSKIWRAGSYSCSGVSGMADSAAYLVYFATLRYYS